MRCDFGFIGTGSMGAAVARAVCRKTAPQQVLLCNRTPEKAQALAKELGCSAGTRQQAAGCRYLFLGVKPHQVGGVLVELGPILAESRPVLVSMAAGLPLAQLEELAEVPLPIVRIMPNTPVAVGQGVVLWCKNILVSPDDERDLLEALSGCGVTDPLEEELMDAGSALCGCSPAFTALYLEGLADGGVACGIPREKALKYAAAAVSGAAALALETGLHPGQMKDGVCSPGGSTIQGVRVLENRAFRGAAMEAVIQAAQATGGLGKNK